MFADCNNCLNALYIYIQRIERWNIYIIKNGSGPAMIKYLNRMHKKNKFVCRKNEIRKVKNGLFELARNYKNLDKKKKNSKENLKK